VPLEGAAAPAHGSQGAAPSEGTAPSFNINQYEVHIHSYLITKGAGPSPFAPPPGKALRQGRRAGPAHLAGVREAVPDVVLVHPVLQVARPQVPGATSFPHAPPRRRRRARGCSCAACSMLPLHADLTRTILFRRAIGSAAQVPTPSAAAASLWLREDAPFAQRRRNCPPPPRTNTVVCNAAAPSGKAREQAGAGKGGPSAGCGP